MLRPVGQTAHPPAVLATRGERAISIGILLFVFLLFTKACLIAWYLLAKHFNPLADVHGAGVLLIAGYDAFLCLSLSVIVLLLSHVGRLHAAAKLLLARLAPPALYIAIVTFTVASFQVTRIYQSPLDITILRSGDDLIVIADSIGNYLDWLPITLLVIGLAAHPLLRRRIARRLARRRWLRSSFSLWAAFGGIGLALPAAEFASLKQVDTMGVKDNAVVFFIRYYEPEMGPIDTPRLLAELDRKLAGREAQVTRSQSLIKPGGFVERDFPAPNASGRGMNLVLIQMESTTALQIDPQSAPNLTALAANGLRFRNHTTTFTETSRASYSVHFSDYMPDLGTQPSLVYGRPMPQTTFAEALRGAGYRTGLFHAGFLDFMELRYYLKDKGFETLVSVRELKEKGLKVSSPSGMREEEALDALEEWVRSHRGERFCAVYMTLAPHHPYHCYSDDNPFDQETWLGRYRNSLHYADASIGRLVQFLRDEKVLDDTLIVVYGDHGETISTYPVGHGIALSAEELMTPFIISNPRLFPSAAESRVFSNHLDIAPTVLSLLGLKAPAEWLGRNLCSQQIPARLLFSRVLHIRKTAVIDNGLLYALDERKQTGEFYDFREGTMQSLAATDSRRGLEGAYSAAVDLFRAWNVQHHLGRAAGRPPPQDDKANVELLRDVRN
jgi:hypothetical protein